MYQFERQDRIMALLRQAGQIEINRDAAKLGVSRSTLHRDLERLQGLGLVQKVRGGATMRPTSVIETHFDLRLKAHPKEKQALARVAARFVEDDTAIFLDHSSTTLFLARELQAKSFKNLIIVSNSLALAAELGEVRGIQVILTGGVVEPEFKALSGRYVWEFLQRFNLHQIFASVGGLSVERGLMTQIPFIYELLPQVFGLGGRINILVDSAKFRRLGTFQAAPLGPGLRIFTDPGLAEEDRAAVRATGAELVI